MKNSFLFFVGIYFLFTVNSYSQTIDTVEYKFKSFATLGVDFVLHNGMWMGTVPAIPTESTVSIAGTSFHSPAFGINMNWNFIEHLSLYFDINRYNRKTPVAYKGSYASGDWVFEQTDYNFRIVGPFTDDAFYSVKTTGFRLGLKGYLQHKKTVQPWAGVYWGYYSVTHGIYTKDLKQTWGNATDYVSGLTYMNIGVDIWDKSRSFALSVYVEGGSPADRNYKIENLINTGWTFQDYGEGEPIFGYYRLGIALMSYSSKKK